MAEISPFRGYRFNPKKVGALDQVVTQPYDKIKEDLQTRYYEASEYNIVRIIKGRSFPSDKPGVDDVYTRAAKYFQEWMEKEILIRDTTKPCIYAYDQEYVLESGESKVRRAFIALSKLQEFGKGVLPHERTLAGPKADRLNLMKTTHATFGLIFMLYSDPENRVNNYLAPARKKPPLIEVKDHLETVHRVWQVSNPEVIENIRQAMADKTLFIADGHHRYETALNYSQWVKEQGFQIDSSGPETPDFCMMAMINFYDPGLTILPTHRLIHNLTSFNPARIERQFTEFFQVSEIPFSDPEQETLARNKLETGLKKEKAQNKHTFGVAMHGLNKYLLLTLKNIKVMDQIIGEEHSSDWKQLDVSILHSVILDKLLGIDAKALEQETNVAYERSFHISLEQVKSGKYQLALLLNPTKIEQVAAVAEHQEKMPQKSTDFYPKVLTGLVANKIGVKV